MTASKGMLWKTAWRRRTGGFVQQPPVDMWFLSTKYKAASAAPAFTQGPVPFWYGFIGLGSGGGNQPIVDAQVVDTNGIFIEFEDILGENDVFLLFNVNPTNGFDRTLNETVNPLVPYVPGTTPTVGFVYVYQDPANPAQNLFQIWVDGQWIATQSGPPYVAATNGILLEGLYNGLVGGVGSLTQQDIVNWFANVKQQKQIVPAPGMTDIWSATAVAPAAPAVLPNGGSGQALNQTVAGTNTLFSVVFNY